MNARPLLLLFALQLTATLQAQPGTLRVMPGANLKITGQTSLKLSDLSFDVKGNFSPGNGTVEFQGNAAGTTIDGAAPVNFKNLTINNAQGIALKQAAKVAGDLTFSAGKLDLGGHDLTLEQPGAKLVGESEQNRIVGPMGGEVVITAALNSPNAANPGNIGIELTSANNLGTTTIRRGHVSELVTGGGKSVERYFTIAPAQNSTLAATLRFHYFDTELAGLPEANLQLFRKTGAIWESGSQLGAGVFSQNPVANFVEKAGIGQLAKFTLAACSPTENFVQEKICEGSSLLFNGKELTAAGVYKDTLLSQFGCDSVVTLTLQVLTKPTAMVANLINNECIGGNNGSVNIVASGGMPPYSCSGDPDCQFANLAAGSYSITVSDANQCSQTIDFQIITKDDNPPKLFCPADLTVCKGKATTLPAPVAEDNCDLPLGALQLLSSIPAGNIFISPQEVKWQVTDAAGNTATCAFQVELAPEISISYAVVDDQNMGNGSINVTPGGMGYAYIWQGPNNFSATTEDISNLVAGDYLLFIKDLFGCTDTFSIEIKTVGTAVFGGNKALLRLLPNPTMGNFKIEFENLQLAHGRICNPQGLVLRQLAAADLLQTIEVGELPAGVYFIEIQVENGQMAVLKLLKN